MASRIRSHVRRLTANRSRVHVVPLDVSAYPGATAFEKLLAYVTAKRRDLKTSQARTAVAMRLHQQNPNNIVTRKT